MTETAYDKHKALGNKLFLEKLYFESIEEYTLAIDSTDSETPSKAVAILYSNRSQAQLKLENYGLVIQDTSESIKHDETFVKSWYRRAVAKYAIKDLDGALRDLKQARELSPNDSRVKALDKEIKQEIRTMKFEQAIDVVEKSPFASIDWSSFPIVKAQTEDSDTVQAELKKGQYIGKVMETRLNIELLDSKSGDVKVKGLDTNFISQMIDYFKRGWKLSHNDAFAIVAGANTLFSKESSLVEIGLNPDENGFLKDAKKITVCGDTHGQFYDVLNIFEKFGQINDEHAYLFNGDFVDRGSWSCEVALLLYSYKILYPDRIFINRGNHETNDMNQVYGFEDECKKKYNERLFRCFSVSFQSLPYSTVIGGEYIVMHGGLFSEKDVTLEDIRSIDRFKNKQPPKEGLEMELLWTDPQPDDGFSPSKRGIGMQFGPDVTAKFLERNNLKYVIRSHEVRQNGYLFEHNNKLITVFSAPNYCDAQGNLGAVLEIQFKNNQYNLQPHSFSAVWHPEIPPMNYTKNQFGF